jgi:predicted Ser/Thr protein kinase
MTAQDHTPERLGPYRLMERLGEGGMGVVYLAADEQQRRVAVKALRPAIAADPNARRRLAREVETMRRVRSPFVAEVLDADVTSDPPYIVTRYVSGRTLEDVVSQDGPLAGAHLARLASGLALALSAVHAAGVVHRDLKPGNVMIANGEPVVIDFGIAQVPDSTRLTQTGMFMGTPGYLAPEVIEGKPSGPASDVHSWGATVAFAATGRPPFGTGAFETIFYRIINGQPDLNGFPAPLVTLVGQALSRDPARRPDTAELCRRTAALDPASLVAAAAAAAGAVPFASPGTVADRPAPMLVDRAGAVAPPAAWPPGTRPWPVAAGGVAGARVPDTYGDVLPPVQYGQQGQSSAPPTWPGPSAPGAPATPATPASRSPAGTLLVAASIAAAVAISFVFPVAGTVFALVALMALRAGDRAAGGMSRRRARRGTRASDPLLAAAMFPPALAWSVIRSALLLPLALVAAAIAAAVAVVAVPHHPIPVVCAYAAGMLVAFYGLGPGSAGARRPIRSFFDSVADSPLRATAAFIAVVGVFAAAVAVVASHPPFFWPFGNLTTWLGHFNIVHTLLHQTRVKVLRVFGRS